MSEEDKTPGRRSSEGADRQKPQQQKQEKQGGDPEIIRGPARSERSRPPERRDTGTSSTPTRRESPPSAPPPPGQQRATTQPDRQQPSSRKWLSIAAAGLLGFFAYSFVFQGGQTTTQQPGTPSIVAVGKTDAPSKQHDEELAKHPGRVFVGVSAADIDLQKTQAAVDAANAGQPIPGFPNLPPNIVRDIRREEVKFYTLHVYDTHDEDGDVVKVLLSNGVEFGPILVTNAGMDITVPINPNMPPSISLYAVKDGYPPIGVSVGIKTSDGIWYSKMLSPGETQPIPVKGG